MFISPRPLDNVVGDAGVMIGANTKFVRVAARKGWLKSVSRTASRFAANVCPLTTDGGKSVAPLAAKSGRSLAITGAANRFVTFATVKKENRCGAKKSVKIAANGFFLSLKAAVKPATVTLESAVAAIAVGKSQSSPRAVVTAVIVGACAPTLGVNADSVFLTDELLKQFVRLSLLEKIYYTYRRKI